MRSWSAVTVTVTVSQTVSVTASQAENQTVQDQVVLKGNWGWSSSPPSFQWHNKVGTGPELGSSNWQLETDTGGVDTGSSGVSLTLNVKIHSFYIVLPTHSVLMSSMMQHLWTAMHSQ